MSVYTFSLCLIVLIAGCARADSTTNQKPEWEILFDGNSVDHWRGYNSEEFPKEGWKIEGQELVVAEPGKGGDIITRKKYADFELQLEWKVNEGGNSGIFYSAIEQPDRNIYWSAPEYQILDNENHPDANQGKDGNRKAGSLYDLIPAKPQNARPFGEWNSVKIVANGALVEHWMNGEKVLSYERWTPEWYHMLRNSKFECHPEFGDAREGHIGLQDHGGENDVVHFRNIRVREINGNPSN